MTKKRHIFLGLPLAYPVVYMTHLYTHKLRNSEALSLKLCVIWKRACQGFVWDQAIIMGIAVGLSVDDGIPQQNKWSFSLNCSGLDSEPQVLIRFRGSPLSLASMARLRARMFSTGFRTIKPEKDRSVAKSIIIVAKALCILIPTVSAEVCFLLIWVVLLCVLSFDPFAKNWIFWQIVERRIRSRSQREWCRLLSSSHWIPSVNLNQRDWECSKMNAFHTRWKNKWITLHWICGWAFCNQDLNLLGGGGGDVLYLKKMKNSFVLLSEVRFSINRARKRK